MKMDDTAYIDQPLAERFPSQIKFGTGYNDEVFAGACAALATFCECGLPMADLDGL